MAAAVRTAVIQRKNEVAFLGHEFVPEKRGAAPRVAHHMRVRAAVGVDQHGILFLRIEIRRSEDAGVQRNAVAGLDGEKFRG